MAFQAFLKNPTDKSWTYVDTACPYAAKASFTTRVAAGAAVTPKLQQNSLQPGMVIELFADGKYSSTGTPTFTLDLGFGTSTTLPAATGLTIGMVTGSGVTGVSWSFQAQYEILTTTTAIGSARAWTSEAAYIAVNNCIALTTADTIDTTVDNYLCLALTCSASSSSNSITVGSVRFRVG